MSIDDKHQRDILQQAARGVLELHPLRQHGWTYLSSTALCTAALAMFGQMPNWRYQMAMVIVLGTGAAKVPHLRRRLAAIRSYNAQRKKFLLGILDLLHRDHNVAYRDSTGQKFSLMSAAYRERGARLDYTTGTIGIRDIAPFTDDLLAACAAGRIEIDPKPTITVRHTRLSTPSRA